MKTILIVILALFLLGGCKTKEVIRYVDIPSVSVRIDSFTIQRTDSFREFTKGDTIYSYRWKTLFKDRVKIKMDTINIPFEVRVPFEVEKEVIKYKHDTVWYVGLLFIIGTLLFLLYKIIK